MRHRRRESVTLARLGDAGIRDCARACEQALWCLRLGLIVPSPVPLCRSSRRCWRRQDNLSANWTPDIRAYAQANKIELVPTLTCASHLDRIESPFRPIQNSCFNNTDYRYWDAARCAVADYITHRNGADRDPRVAALERKHRVAACTHYGSNLWVGPTAGSVRGAPFRSGRVEASLCRGPPVLAGGRYGGCGL